MSLPGIAERPIRVRIFGKTDPGRNRSENQDSFLVADLERPPGDGGYLLGPRTPPPAGAMSGEITLGPRGALVIVADGMGGAAAGALASRLAAAWIHEEMVERWRGERDPSPLRFAVRLRESVEAANNRIHEEAKRDPARHGMGSTATVAGILDGFVYLAQVGDSRAYHVRGGTTCQLTRDQSLVQQLIEAGEMTPEEAERSRHRSMILQALGTSPAIRVEMTYQEVRRGDVVLLCSDGLSRVVRDDEIARAVAATPEPDALCAELVELANARGGPDNITVVAARLDGPGLDDPLDGDAVGRNVFALPDR